MLWMSLDSNGLLLEDSSNCVENFIKGALYVVRYICWEFIA